MDADYCTQVLDEIINYETKVMTLSDETLHRIKVFRVLNFLQNNANINNVVIDHINKKLGE